jgi:UDP-MurNAc hydroxylase
MRIEWVNHASFVLEHGSVRLMTDPWLDSPVFDGGVGLLSETAFTPSDFATLTHIWVSHEHPDHFHPASLQRIPEEVRAGITLLYQDTDHHKVVTWAQGQGFKAVIELDPNAWVDLGQGLTVRCMPFSRGDSWIAFRAGGQLVLNLNDCVVETKDKVRQIRAQLDGDRPDLLLSQFSYGGWAGNKDDPEMRQAYANEMLQRLIFQTEGLEPTWVLPMASFVWFCHAENHYMNDRSNRVGTVAAFLEQRCGVKPVVLYPGDSWKLGDKRINRKAIRRYHQDYDRAEAGTDLVTHEPVAIDTLISEAKDFLAQLKKINGRLAMRAFRKSKLLMDATVWLTDHEQALLLSPTAGLSRSDTPARNCDIALSSAALSHCFRFLWGGDNLGINGRYVRPPGGYYHRFKSYFAVASHNHHKAAAPPKQVMLGALEREQAVASGAFAPGQ